MEIEGVLKLTVQLMNDIEDYKEMSGIQKKHYVEHKIIDIMHNQKVSEDVIKGVQAILPSFIDMSVHIAKGAYKFGRKKGCCLIL